MVRPRKCQSIEPDTAVFLIPFDQESFFSALCMTGQCAAGKPLLIDEPRLDDDIHDATRIEPPEPRGVPHHSHDLANLNQCLRRPDIDPSQLELLPPLQNGFRRVEYCLAFTQPDSSLVDHKVRGRSLCGGSHSCISQRQSPLRIDKQASHLVGRLSERQHRDPVFTILSAAGAEGDILSDCCLIRKADCPGRQFLGNCRYFQFRMTTRLSLGSANRSYRRAHSSASPPAQNAALNPVCCNFCGNISVLNCVRDPKRVTLRPTRWTVDKWQTFARRHLSSESH